MAAANSNQPLATSSRLLALPQEILDMIIEKYLLDLDIVIEMTGFVHKGGRDYLKVSWRTASLYYAYTELQPAYATKLQLLRRQRARLFKRVQLHYHARDRRFNANRISYFLSKHADNGPRPKHTRPLRHLAGIEECSITYTKHYSDGEEVEYHDLAAVYIASTITTEIRSLRAIHLDIPDKAAADKEHLHSLRSQFLSSIAIDSASRNSLSAGRFVMFPECCKRTPNIERLSMSVEGTLEVHRTRVIDENGYERWYKTRNEDRTRNLEREEVVSSRDNQEDEKVWFEYQDIPEGW